MARVLAEIMSPQLNTTLIAIEQSSLKRAIEWDI